MFYDKRYVNSKRMAARWRAANDPDNDTSRVDLDSEKSSNSNKNRSPRRRRTSKNLASPSNTEDEPQNAASTTYVKESDKNDSNSRNLHEINKEIQPSKSYITNKREEQEKEKRNNKTTEEPPIGLVSVDGNEARVPTTIISSQVNVNALPQ